MIHVLWIKKGHLQEVFCGIQITAPDSGRTLQVSELDTTHGVLHTHPNGHHPPSGNSVSPVELMDIYSLHDVENASNLCDTINTAVGLRLSGREDGTDEEVIIDTAIGMAKKFAQKAGLFRK